MDEQTRKDIKTKAAIAVLLAQRDQALGQWADAAGEIAALQCELSDAKTVTPNEIAALKARIAELETTVMEKDEQIAEQSKTIVELRT